ncbi:helix-turn-helix transcriptional regulator [Kutzneria chonburiensis]|uniref:AAA family ATPase n=1 Tax=Kutzneria chonburiensis TaxID=1483604 RepID=A0ABV6N5S7_9PSEU|nr:LuxR family transcriptional regulator [Kutzneria chonburiensis]
MSTICGRDAELSALDSAFAGVGPRRHVLVVIRGARGIGKSALLTAFSRRTSDALVLSAAFRDAVPPWDEFGATAVLAMTHRHFEEFAERRLAASVEAVRGLTRPLTYRSPEGRAALLTELARLFARLSRQREFVLLADDVDALPAQALAALCPPRSLIVATCTDDAGLGRMADHVLDVGPLPAEFVGPLLARATGAAFDESTLRRLFTALGPLSRHPATLLSTVDELRRDGRLAVVHGRTCITDDKPVLVPAQLCDFDAVARHLLAMAPFNLDDLPLLVDGSLAEYGSTVDELVRRNVLACDADGRVTCPVPALASRVIFENGSPEPTAEPVRVPARHTGLVHDFRTGDWTAVLAAARRLELGPSTELLRMARLLAAEVCTEQGDERQAMAWLKAGPTDERLAVLRAWVESGLRMRLGEHRAAFDLGWRAHCQAQGTLPGRKRLLMRLIVIAVLDGDHDRAAMVLNEITDPSLELFARSAIQHDLDGLHEYADLARLRGHLPELLTVCLLAGGLAPEPRPWLHEAHEIATRLGARPLRARARDLMRLRGVSTPRRAAQTATALSATELRIATLIRHGRTNRQIAVALQMSEKTVEYHLSRVFTKTGARTRVDVATAMVKCRSVEAISA